jgi:hypothetical protein
MKRSSRLLSVAKRSGMGFGAAFLLMAAMSSSVLAATPVDVYQDMESGNSGDLLTPTIMNASSHGNNTSWAVTGTLWVATIGHRNLPGPVTVSGVTYNGTGGTRSWMFMDNTQAYRTLGSLSSSYSRMTVACYFTPGYSYNDYTVYDNVNLTCDSGSWAVLQTDHFNKAAYNLWSGLPGGDYNNPYPSHYFNMHSANGSVSTVSPQTVAYTPGKTYWVNVQYDGVAGVAQGAIFDPDNNFAQVGVTMVSQAVPNSHVYYGCSFGRADAHGNQSYITTDSYVDQVLYDYTNAAFPLVPGHTYGDITPPSIPVAVRDGTGADIATTSSTTQLSANWDACTDAESGMSGYQYAIGTIPGGKGLPGSTDVVDWTSLGNVTSVTRTGLSLTVGATYYFNIRAVNTLGLIGTARVSNGQTVVSGGDSTPPSAPPAVRDGTGADISTTTSTTQLSANWDASTDNESGISGYQYAIGTSAGGTQTVNWTSLGNVTTVTKTGLTLTVGQTYFFSVKAVNGAGLTGNATNSNGQTVVAGGSGTTYFQDDFENWVTRPGQWDILFGGSGTTPVASTDQAAAGTHSLKLTLSNAGNLTKNFSPVVGGDLYVRFYVFLPTGWEAANSGSLMLLQVYDGLYDKQLQVWLQNGGVPLFKETHSYTSVSGSKLSENAWHCIESHLAPPSTSTLMEFWVDGVKLSQTLTADFSTGSGCNTIIFGDCSDASNTGSIYLDEFIFSNRYNGPLGTDSTPPSAPATVRDGTGTDISTTSSTTQLSANWDASTDAESGISGYQYAIGTSAGGTQTVNWTSLGNVTTVTKTGLTLTVGQTYYFGVRAVNGAGLTGSATNSNGQTVTSSSTTYFQDDFESWSVHGGAWSSVNGESSSHTLNTSTDRARSGTKSLKLTDTDSVGTTGASLTKNFSPAISEDIYVRFYVFYPTGYWAGNVGDARRVLRIYCGGNRGQLSFKNSAPVMEEIGAWSSTTGATITENAWHCIEMHIAPPSASTLLEFWVDGVRNSVSLTANFSASSTFDHIDLGDVVIGNGQGDDTFYLDEAVVSNSYIGTLP